MKLDISISGKRHQVASLAEASRLWREYVETNGIGASEMRRGDGKIHRDGRYFVAYVSYNGRVWTSAGQEIEVNHAG